MPNFKSIIMLLDTLSHSMHRVFLTHTFKKFTPENGQLHIKLLQNPILQNGRRISDDDQLPLRIFAQKNSGSLTHTFLCDNEELQCPDVGHITYLSHMGFNKVIQFADASTITMSGTVSIGGVDGCRLPGVEVCLHKKVARAGLGRENDLVVECKNTGEVFSFGFSQDSQLTILYQTIHI